MILYVDVPIYVAQYPPRLDPESLLHFFLYALPLFIEVDDSIKR
jgi:hypothetical protein